MATQALLLDASRKKGVDSLAQVRLKERAWAKIPTVDLTEAAYATATAAMSRVSEEELDEHVPGPLSFALPGRPMNLGRRRVAVEERPPLANLPPSALSP